MNKKHLFFSSLLTLLPIPVGLLLWNQFPDYMVIHWGLNGQPDGMGSIAFVVFFAPLAMLAAQWVCIWFTAKDPGNKGRNQKPLNLVLWILPIVSNLCSGMMYALALGLDISVTNIMTAAMGLMFAVIGNYLPKCRMNSTIGIKVPWTYSSEENWNATHRFGGRVWFIGGIVMVFSGLIPGAAGMTIMIIAVFLLAFLPILYSYQFYRREKQEGKALFPKFSKADKTIMKWSTVYLVVILVGVLFLLFTGDINIVYGENAFTVEASYYSDRTVKYEDIEAIEYREGNVPGLRVGGFGTPRLLMGFFENEEFGTYTRYTYGKPEGCVVLQVKGKILVLSGIDREASQTIFIELMERTGDVAVSVTLPDS